MIRLPSAPRQSLALIAALLLALARLTAAEEPAKEHGVPTEADAAVVPLSEHPAAHPAPATATEQPPPAPADAEAKPAEASAVPTPAAGHETAPATGHAEAAPATPAAPHGDTTAPAAHAETKPDASEFVQTDTVAKAMQAQGLVNLGTSLTERGDFPAAEIAFRQILQDAAFADADQRSALLGLARMFRKKGEFTKAAAVYEKFLKVYPEDSRVPDALLELGRTQRALGAPKIAINRFYNVINSTLKVPTERFEHYQLLAKTAQFEIAETHFEAGNYAEAGKFFARLRLLDLAPADRARAHFKSAFALMLAGDLERSVTTLRNYLVQWPTDVNVPEARYLLATTLRRLDRKQEALDATLELLQAQKDSSVTDPQGWAYWQRRTGNQLANDFFQSGDTLNAVSIYEGLARLSDQPGWRLPISYQIALCYERLRQVDRSAQAYREITEAVAATPDAPPELAELAKMAAWRLSQLDWTDGTERQLTSFFGTATVAPKPAAPAPPAPSAHESPGSPATAPTNL